MFVILAKFWGTITLGIMEFSIMTPSILAFSIMTPSITIKTRHLAYNVILSS